MADGSAGLGEAAFVGGAFAATAFEPRPSGPEAAYLRFGLDQPGRKLPLFDAKGRPIRPQVIRVCIARGWAEQWFANPLAPDWLVCRLTDEGARVAARR